MFQFLQRSVRAKLLALILATTGVALVVAVSALAVHDLRTYHERWVSDLSTQAEILGRSSVAALAFDDAKTAQANLDVLKARPSILVAAIYDENGRPFATYRREGLTHVPVPAAPSIIGARVEGDHVVLFQKIIEDQRERGVVYIRADYELVGRLAEYLGILAAVMVISMVAALIVSAWLQRAISGPITDIADVAHQVMDKRDFSLRVTKTTQDEIGYLVDTFNNMLAEIGRRSEALLAADRMKDQFLATLAHELRNPLAPISNALHLLEAAGDKPEVAATARRMMTRQLKQLVRLVDDLLDVSRITTGKLVLHKEEIALHKVIENAVEIARPLIEARRHQLTVDLPGRLMILRGDATRLAQVFSNLLNNAARYTDNGGKIALRAELQGDHVQVSITDNGMGMSEDVLPNIFQMFTQANTSLERGEAGLGVGLALALHLVTMHGGSIEAHSEGLGRGSRLTVRLPLAHAVAVEAAPALVAPEQPTDTHRVLVVDDNQDFATSLAMILRDLGNDVRVASDGLEGLRAAEAFQPTVAFIDIGMPGLNGYELAQRLRENGRNGSMMLVAVTGWGQDADKLRAAQAGFDLHLVKPVDPAGLPGILQSAAEKRKRSGQAVPAAQGSV